jgi:hypothetical protein
MATGSLFFWESQDYSAKWVEREINLSMEDDGGGSGLEWGLS